MAWRIQSLLRGVIRAFSGLSSPSFSFTFFHSLFFLFFSLFFSSFLALIRWMDAWRNRLGEFRTYVAHALTRPSFLGRLRHMFPNSRNAPAEVLHIWRFFVASRRRLGGRPTGSDIAGVTTRRSAWLWVYFQVRGEIDRPDWKHADSADAIF